MNDILITGRPFFSNGDNETADSQRGEVSLGIKKEEIEKIAQQGKIILEIGPGFFTSTQQLESMGAKVIVIEPGLRGTHSEEIVDRIDKLRIQSKVLGISTEDLYRSTEIRDSSIRLAFAIGPNFQNYQESAINFLDSLKGILSKLDLNEGELVFEITLNKRNKASLNFIHPSLKSKGILLMSFDLQDFLDFAGIDYFLNISDDFSQHSIRIKRLTKDGKDALKILEEIPESKLFAFVQTFKRTNS